MPAYNEEANIEKVIRAWYPLLQAGRQAGRQKISALSKLVVADSGSVDNTHAILLELQKELPQLEVLSDTGKQHGPKVIALYDYAIRNHCDYIFQTDSDGQTNPLEFDAFWQQRNNYDAIFGNRTHRGDGKSRAFVEKVVCMLVKLFFGVNVPDANAPFRLMKADKVKEYLYRLPAEYNLPNIMLTVYFAYYGAKIRFCEISFKPRQGGVNSINIPRIVTIGWKALSDFYTFRKGMKH